MHLIKIPMIKKFSGQSNLLHFSTTLHSRFLSEILCIFVGRLGPGSCLQHIISTLLQLTGYLGELKSRLLTWRRRGADAEAWIRADTVYYDDSVDIKFIWVRVTCCKTKQRDCTCHSFLPFNCQLKYPHCCVAFCWRVSVFPGRAGGGVGGGDEGKLERECLAMAGTLSFHFIENL